MSSGIHNEIAYEDSGIPQPYHLVRPSIWPIIGAFFAGLLAVGMLFFMHDGKLGGMTVGLKGVFLGLAGVITIMCFWWRDVIREATFERAHSPIAKVGLRYGYGAVHHLGSVSFSSPSSGLSSARRCTRRAAAGRRSASTRSILWKCR